MYLKRLGLEQFRCYDRLSIDFGPGLSVLAGANASGKTSVLEAIFLLATTKSHRTSSDRELVQWGQDWARAGGVFQTDQRGEVSLRVTLHDRRRDSDANGSRKTIEVNSVPRRRLAQIVGQTSVVLFGPDDLELVKGSPGTRRRFMNTAIAQVRPAYLADLMRYRRAVRQRNECLKSIVARGLPDEMLYPWDSQLIQSAAQLSMDRAEFVRALAPHVRHVHQRLSAGSEQIDIEYNSDLAQAHSLSESRDLMQELMQVGLARDKALGRTSRGPHRDDIIVRMAGKSVRTFGSQGQQRTAALSLKLAEATVVREWSHESPIVLLDDCLSELDTQRAREVLALTHSVQQVIVTTAAWDRLLQEYATAATVFDVVEADIRER